jgi:hypothetical protein
LPSLSIVIPTWNGWPLLERCLATVTAHRPAGTEIIVVDDGSTDGTAARLPAAFPDVTLVRLRRNRGFCGAANAGLRAAAGDVIELLNNDTEVTSGWCERPLALLAADPTLGSVAPQVRRLPERGRLDSAGDHYSPIGIARKRGEGQPVGEGFEESAEVFGASASSAFYRRTALERTGGFPEHFNAYLDDVDLACRLRLAGFGCRYEPGSVVYHWVSRTHSVKGRRVQAQVARNSERVFWTNTRPRDLALYLLPHLAYVVMQLGYRSVRGDFGPWFAGKVSILAELPELWRQRQAAQELTRDRPPPPPVDAAVTPEESLRS